MSRAGLWGGASTYDRYMGRWSREIAPLFVRWLAVPAHRAWIDIGCGTGVLTHALVAEAAPSRVVGVDPSEAFIEAARSRIHDERVEFVQGTAEALAQDDDAFAAAVSGLVLNFVGDKRKAVAEMTRVVEPGGTVALYVWDYAGGMQIMRCFFDAAVELDAKASAFDDGVQAPVCRPGPLSRLFLDSAVEDVEVRAIDIPAAFESFDDYWAPFLGGTGSAPKYCASLTEDARGRLREKLRDRLPTGPDGEILLAARAWAVKGTVGT